MIEFLSRAFGGDKSGKPKGKKRINLALQGGGAHGAFTWGVLDALLEDGRLAIEGISGTSAGAMNAAILACGLAGGGPADRRSRSRLRESGGGLGLDFFLHGGSGGGRTRRDPSAASPSEE